MGGDPVNRIDPSGLLFCTPETLWDAGNAAMGWTDAYDSFSSGDYAQGTLEALGAAIDTVAAAIPVVPGGASSVIKGGAGIGGALARFLTDVKWGEYADDGCLELAKRIQKAIGGDVRKIESKKGGFLGGVKGERDLNWGEHYVVDRDGLIYDQKYPNGIPIDEYKDTWNFSDFLDFDAE